MCIFLVVLLAFAMAGAPIASGMVFGAALTAAPAVSPTRWSGKLLASNTVGGVLGVFLCGYLGMPFLGIRGMVVLLSFVCVGCAMYLGLRYRFWLLVSWGLLWLVAPSWDHAIYSVGIYNRIGSLSKRDPRSIERFAHRGWTLEYYKDGKSASVAVGKSKRTGTLWLSINGKVDASTGRDMPTQILSGKLPVEIYRGQENSREDIRALVVGLASGVTAAETRKAGAQELQVLEIEGAVVEAAALFREHNNNILQDAHTQIITKDARAFLAQEQQRFDVIVSEPSNPWLTGISNFYGEYWQLTQCTEGVFVSGSRALQHAHRRISLDQKRSVYPNASI